MVDDDAAGQNKIHPSASTSRCSCPKNENRHLKASSSMGLGIAADPSQGRVHTLATIREATPSTDFGVKRGLEECPRGVFRDPFQDLLPDRDFPLLYPFFTDIKLQKRPGRPPASSR